MASLAAMVLCAATLLVACGGHDDDRAPSAAPSEVRTTVAAAGPVF